MVPLFGLAPGRACRVSPALRRFVTVALVLASRRTGVTRYLALWCSDFPQEREALPRPSDLLGPSILSERSSLSQQAPDERGAFRSRPQHLSRLPGEPADLEESVESAPGREVDRGAVSREEVALVRTERAREARDVRERRAEVRSRPG